MAKIRYDSKGRVLPQGITEVGPDRYKVRFMYHGESYSENVTGLAKAKRTLEDLKFKARRNLVEKNDQSLNDWFDMCLDAKKLKESTKNTYENAWNKWVRPSLGKRKPADISRIEIQSFLKKIAKDVGGERVKLIYTLLNSTLEEAMYNSIFQKNPAEGVIKRIDLKKYENTRQKALTEDEQLRFLKFVYAINDVYKELYTVFFYTGMRISEIAALTEENLDFKNDIIRVEYALKYISGRAPLIEEPKSGKRIIPMLPIVKEALRSRIDYLKATGFKCKYDERFIFFSTRKNYIQSTPILLHTKSILDKMDAEDRIRGFTNHAMRHSFATRLKEKQVMEDYIAIAMGHKNIEVTRKNYIDLYVDQEKIKAQIFESGIDKIQDKLKS